jgi:hypothetical protein
LGAASNGGRMRRAGRVVGAIVIYLVTGLAVLLMILIGAEEAPGVWVPLGLASLVAGLWCAWRVGSGRWGLWRGRQGHPVLAFLITLMTVFGLIWACSLGMVLTFPSDEPPNWAVKLFSISVPVICVGVFWLAWRYGTRRWGRWPPLPPPPSDEPPPPPADEPPPAPPA